MHLICSRLFVRSFFTHCLVLDTKLKKKTTFDVEFGCCCCWWCCFDCCIRTTNFVVRNLTFHFLCRLSSFQTITFVSFLFFSSLYHVIWISKAYTFGVVGCCCWLLMLCYYYWSRSLQTYSIANDLNDLWKRNNTHALTSRFLIREKEWDGFWDRGGDEKEVYRGQDVLVIYHYFGFSKEAKREKTRANARLYQQKDDDDHRTLELPKIKVKHVSTFSMILVDCLVPG